MTERRYEGQSMWERYGEDVLSYEVDTDGSCPHKDATLMFVHPLLDEWYCWDCQRKIKVWQGL